MTELLIDTNVILRYVLGDDPRSAKAAHKLARRARAGEVTLIVHPTVLLEAIQVLESVYGVGRTDIVHHLLSFAAIPGVTLLETQDVEQAIRTFSRNNLDFVDCLLSTASNRAGAELATFDKQLAKLETVKAYAW